MTDYQELTPERQRLVREWQGGLTGKWVRVSRAKREDYPHGHLRFWLSRVAEAAPAAVRGGGQGGVVRGVLRGMGTVADKRAHALLVDLEAGAGIWALRRSDGWAWPIDIEAPDPSSLRIEVADVPVLAWQMAESVLAEPEKSVPAPEDPQRWTLRTVGVEESP